MRRFPLIAILAMVSACSSPETPPATETQPVPAANVQTREVQYEQNGTKLQGLMAWDENQHGPRAGVLVVHEWWGHDEHARNQAKRLAESGYVAFALDMYGDGKQATHPEDAQKFMEEVTRDPAVVAARFQAAADVLANEARVDPERIAAIGYCFGGSVVLSMARLGANLDAVASFHGVLAPLAPVRPGSVKARVLVLTGDADSFAPPDQVEAFRKEMTAAGANFRIVTYPGAKHSFTNPKAADHNMPGLEYNAKADEQSWREMLKLLEESFY